MHFDDEMKQMFVRMVQGKVHLSEWETWWNSHIPQLEAALLLGDRNRIMPADWKTGSYRSMFKSQSGIAYYFYRQGRPVKPSNFYETKAKEQEQRQKEEAMQIYYDRIAPYKKQWDLYLEKHPTKTINFEWHNLLGTPPNQKPPTPLISQHGKTIEWYKQNREALKLCLKENMTAKIAPLAKAYGMKKVGKNFFVKTQNDLVYCLWFRGYFRGGGYEAMGYHMGPLYAIEDGFLELPGHICHGDTFQKIEQDWSEIQYDVDAINVDKINQEFDYILTFLAEEVFPEWHKIDSLETYFSLEHQAYLQATETGPIDPLTQWPMWETEAKQNRDPWHARDYTLGVWELLSGKEEEGYKHLESCVQQKKSYYCGDYNDRSSPDAILYHNAELFANTKQIKDHNDRKNAILKTYDEVCQFMKYYYRLTKRVER